MGKFKWLFLILFLIAGYLAFQTANQRYFKNSAEEKEIAPQSEENQEKSEVSESSTADNQKEAVDVLENSEISRQDCANECENFQADSAKLEYCRNFCEIKPEEEADVSTTPKKPDDSDCEAQNGINKDYCLRDKAIAEKNYDLCEEISDAALKQSCKTRVVEDLLE